MLRASKRWAIAGLLIVASPLGVALAQSDNQTVEVLTHLGATPDQGAEFASNMMPIDVVPFRFGDDPAGAATLFPADFPWMQPNAMGADLVQFPADFAGPTFPPGTIIATVGNGLVPGGTYGLFLTSYNGEMTEENMGGLHVNISVPTILPGREHWTPFPQFPADTWGGAGTIPYLTYGPNPWGLAMSQVQGGGLVDVPFNGMAFVGHGTSGILVDIDSLVGPDGNWNDLMYGFAMHAHDGTFGSCATCQSAIYADPQIGPGGSLDRLFHSTMSVDSPLLFGGATRVVPSTTTTTPSTSTTTTTISSSTTTILVATADDGGLTTTGVTPTNEGGMPIFFIGLVLLGVAIAAGGGYLWTTARSGAAVATAPTSWATTIATAPTQEVVTTVSTTVVPTPPLIVTKGERPGKGAGGDAETPPKIGVGGAIP